MLKKTLLFSLLIGLSNVTLASHFYFGGKLGYRRLADVTATPIPGANGVTTQSKTLFGDGATGGLFFGYLLNITNKVNIAAEIDGNITNAESEVLFSATSNNNQTAGQKITSDYGFNLLPAFKLTDKTSIFAIIGYTRARVKTFNTRFNFSGSTRVFTASVTDRRWVHGLEFGGGAQIQMNNHFALRGEYVAKRYRSYNFNDTVEGLIIGEKPATYEIDLGMVYTLQEV